MKKIFLLAILLSVLCMSCAHGITMYGAAHGKAKHGRFIN